MDRKSFVKALCRRGAAYSLLGGFKQGLLDYEYALSLDPSNIELSQDVNELRKHAHIPATGDELQSE